MRASPSDRAVRHRALLLTAVAAVGTLTALPIQAQDTSIVSKTVTFGNAEAALAVVTAGGAELAIRFDEGTVSLDGDVIGTYEPGGALEDSWRSLLARAVQLDDGPLADALVDWTPPEGLEADAGDVAQRVDGVLEALLAGESGPAVAPVAPNVVDGSALSSLFSRLDVLGSLGALVDDLQLDDLRIVIGEDFDVDRDMVVDGDVLVVDGDVEIAGRIRGDLLVADGDVEFRDGGVVEGDLRYTQGFLDLDGGTVLGDVSEIDGTTIVVDADFRNELRDQIRADIESEVRTVAPRSRSRGAFSRIGSSIGEIVETLLTIFVLGLFGVMAHFFAGDNIDRISEVARRSPGRTGAVGMAAGFLAIPVWIVGIIGLAITIIGIPALIVWAPGFPIVVMLAAGLGYVAVARNVGTWLTHQDIPGFDWVRVTRPNSLIFGGITVLMAPYLAAAVLGLGGGFMGGIRDLATFMGVVIGFAAIAVGFGAVLVTRGGRRTEYAGDDWYGDLQDLGSELGDLRGFASDFGRRWTGGESTATDVPTDAGAPAGTDSPTGAEEPMDTEAPIDTDPRADSDMQPPSDAPHDATPETAAEEAPDHAAEEAPETAAEEAPDHAAEEAPEHAAEETPEDAS